jgi:hypothetical protein
MTKPRPLTLHEVAWLVRERDPTAWKRMTPKERQELTDKLNAERDQLIQLAQQLFAGTVTGPPAGWRRR